MTSDMFISKVCVVGLVLEIIDRYCACVLQCVFLKLSLYIQSEKIKQTTIIGIKID